MNTPTRASLAAALALSTAMAGASAATSMTSAISFDRPVLLTTTEGFGGFEPSLVVDRFDNVWATAHRTYTPTSADGRSPSRVRSASWLWTSADGKTFTVPPGTTPANEHEQNFGFEGDLATDSSGNVYFADVSPPKVSFTSWQSTGPGRATATRTTPALAVPAYDRPFLASGPDGTVVLAVNDLGASPLAPASTDDVVAGKHQGQSSLYVSTDGGKTFPTTGAHVPESTFCRPLVPRRTPGVLLVLCDGIVLPAVDDPLGQAKAALLAFVSKDRGRTWTRTLRRPIGDSITGSGIVFPSVAESSDGTVHLLSHHPRTGGSDYTLLLTSSRDLGQTWSTPRELDPAPGMWSLSSITADKRGRLALAGYHRRDASSPWSFKAAVFRPGEGSIEPVEVAPGQVAYPATEEQPPGEFTQAAFDSRGRLRVVYSVRELPVTQPLSNRDGKTLGSSAVYYAQQH